MTQIALQSLSSLTPMEANATGFDEITEFTVLRESNGRSVIRAFTLNSEAEPMRPNHNVLGLGKCFELALETPASHKVTFYRVNGEPVRFIFESRTPFPNPPQPWPTTLPAGSNRPVLWYRCQILLDRIQLQVAGANFFFSTYRFDYFYPELSLLMTALTAGSPYSAVVDGDSTTNQPVLRLSRTIS